MKILFVIRDMFVGGAGKQLAMTANAMSRFGHQVAVYAYCGKECRHRLDENVRYIPNKKQPKSKFGEYFFAVGNIRRQMKAFSPDIVVSWRCNAGCFAVLAAIGLKVKVVFSERSDPFMETSLALKISAFVCNFSDGGVFQLDSVRKYYRRLSKKSVVIPNPFNDDLDQSPFVPYEERKREIVHVARIVFSQKRQDVMLKAFRLFLEKHPDYILSFYGDGPDLAKLRQMTKEFGIEKNVVFHGAVSGIPAKIRSAKLLLLTSDYEGIPNVILEAFSAGVPVVSTDTSPGGAKMLLGDGKNGAIVPCGDVEQLAKKMAEVVEDECLATHFMDAGKMSLTRFDPNSLFLKWAEYLERVLGKETI